MQYFVQGNSIVLHDMPENFRYGHLRARYIKIRIHMHTNTTIIAGKRSMVFNSTEETFLAVIGELEEEGEEE